jgi:VIT1/CCC1 family predicted Fe2+/Mn2+ transporter
VSVKAQNELVEREIEIERRSIAEKPEAETNELASIYEQRGVGPEQARRLAIAIMADPDVALDVHTREELGVSADGLGSPYAAAGSSFLAFAAGAVIPLVPWFFGGGTAAVIVSLTLALLAAVAVGAVIARYTERSVVRTALRQVLVAGASCLVTFLIGSAFGTQVG